MAGKKFTGELQNYNEEFLDCRENHNWKWTTDWGLTTGRGGRLLEFTRTKQCTRCKTVAHRKYDGQTGRVIPNTTRYEYADGYLSTKEHPVDSGAARLEMLRRANLLRTSNSKRTTTSEKEQDTSD